MSEKQPRPDDNLPAALRRVAGMTDKPPTFKNLKPMVAVMEMIVTFSHEAMPKRQMEEALWMLCHTMQNDVIGIAPNAGDDKLVHHHLIACAAQNLVRGAAQCLHDVLTAKLEIDESAEFMLRKATFYLYSAAKIAHDNEDMLEVAEQFQRVAELQMNQLPF